MVVGAGATTLLPALVADGYQHLVAVDISAHALETLAARLGPDAAVVEFVVGDVRDLVLDEPVALWFDRATFHFFTDPADQASYAERAASAVVSGGVLVVAGFAPDGPDRCSGLPVARHDAASLQSVFSSAFELVDWFEHDHVTPWGAVQRFGYGTLRRR